MKTVAPEQVHLSQTRLARTMQADSFRVITQNLTVLTTTPAPRPHPLSPPPGKNEKIIPDNVLALPKIKIWNPSRACKAIA
ncbi:MAG: hypothetical protein EKK49_13260 [Rhodocyclaceae bacterium]|nr:MAG: hypothetical protein EKK49_13260 [Rhodocyclaceae bacterium]